MNNENLYQQVRSRICDQIFDGRYDNGDSLPPERELESLLEVSRVTVRKSLELLEEEQLIVREVGRGTRITLHNYGNKSELDMIVLIAPARNPFFSEFIGRFQNYAWKQGSLLLYVEKPRTENLEDCLYRLYKRGLRNVVVWLEDLTVDKEKLKRLRAIGMNMVFFDSDKGIPYADCVGLDNESAIQSLYDEVKILGYRKIGYIGWNQKEIYSTRKREEAYLLVENRQEFCLSLPWKDKEGSERIVEAALSKVEERPEAMICSDRDSGEIVVKAVKKLGIDMKIATVDEISENDRQGIIMYKQDLNASVEQIFACLRGQSTQETNWKAKLYPVKGNLINQQLCNAIK